MDYHALIDADLSALIAEKVMQWPLFQTERRGVQYSRITELESISSCEVPWTAYNAKLYRRGINKQFATDLNYTQIAMLHCSKHHGLVLSLECIDGKWDAGVVTKEGVEVHHPSNPARAMCIAMLRALEEVAVSA